MTKQHVKKAMDVLDTMKLSKDEQEVYEARLKWLRDEASAIKKAQMDGRAEGIELTAKNMLKEGIDVEVISKVTGLSKEAISKLS